MVVAEPTDAPKAFTASHRKKEPTNASPVTTADVPNRNFSTKPTPLSF
jgi:hypothetical protein